MKEHIIYEIPHIYRDDFRVRGFSFGKGEKALCIVGNMRGNEYQQIYMASQMVQRLKKLEAQGRLIEGQEILVIPSVNPRSMNIRKRFWGNDNTDINRMFPGYNLGETTQRIAAGVFEVINKYRTGMQFSSYYMPGEFQPHVLMIHSGFENTDKAQDFGLPYVAVRDPRPYDTTTLNYNWQLWETNAYSLYSTTTTRIDPESATLILDGIERFMMCNGILKGTPEETKGSRVFSYDDLVNVRTSESGFYRSLVNHKAHVEAQQPLAQILDPCSGEVLETLISPTGGVVFFQHCEPLIYAYTSALKILANEKE